jgi:hypothetical protein
MAVVKAARIRRADPQPSLLRPIPSLRLAKRKGSLHNRGLPARCALTISANESRRSAVESDPSLEQTQRYLNVTDEELRRGLQVSWNRRAQPVSPDGVNADANRAGRNNSQLGSTSVDSRVIGSKTAHDCLQFVTTPEKSWLSEREVSQPGDGLNGAQMPSDQHQSDSLERLLDGIAREDRSAQPACVHGRSPPGQGLT